MSSRYKVYDDEIPHFVTNTVIGWVDAFSRDIYKEIICDSLMYCVKEKGLRLHAWVIMSNHIHLIISMESGKQISACMRDFKKFTSKAIISAIGNPEESRRKWMLNMFEYSGKLNNSNEQYQFWQQDYHPVILDTGEKLLQRLSYLHENPVRAGIVWEAPNYKYSSAIDYCEDKPGLLPLSRLVI